MEGAGHWHGRVRAHPLSKGSPLALAALWTIPVPGILWNHGLVATATDEWLQAASLTFQVGRKELVCESAVKRMASNLTVQAASHWWCVWLSSFPQRIRHMVTQPAV